MATVCLTFDFDAVSNWLISERDSPTNRTRGLFGAEVGAPRVLDLLSRHGVEATWFVPGHTIESFPEKADRVWSEGHEIQHHGWTHTPPADYDSREAERADFERGIEAIADLTGREPIGYRSPSWDFSAHTVDILLELGFEWDSSGMAREFELYRVRQGERAERDAPYERGEETDMVEVPVSWQRDDFPPFVYRGNGFVDEAAVFRAWREKFDWMYENVDAGVFVLTMHPQVIGHSNRIARLEELIEHVESRPEVEFSTVSVAVEEFREE